MEELFKNCQRKNPKLNFKIPKEKTTLNFNTRSRSASAEDP